MRNAIIGPDGELEVVTPDDVSSHDLTGRTTRADVPDDWPELSVWNEAAQAWAENVIGERARLIEILKGVREAAINNGCDTPLGRVQTDPGSREAINAAVSGALMAKLTSQPFTAMWTMTDNTIVAHSADQMLALGAAVLTCVGAAQAAYESKRGVLNSAKTIADLRAV